MIRRSALAAMMLSATPAAANDSIAELGTGGLILGRTDAISMEREDLSISMDRVTVDYVFRNQTDKNVESVVAFPMPDIAANPYTMPALPDGTSDNFLDFEVMVAGKAVKPALEQKAFAVGLDVTEELKAAGVPVNPFSGPAIEALAGLPQSTVDDWMDRGLLFIDSYDDGSGWKDVRTPLWTLKSTYWWTAAFPANSDVRVSHRYKPSLGATAGLSFFFDGQFQNTYQDYKKRFCLDQAFERAVRKAAKAAGGYPQLMEYRLQYVLTTGGNWALGNIGRFKLTIDKGSSENLVSFCGQSVKKTGPTTFEVSEEQFYPQRDIDILILKPFSFDEPMAERGGVVDGKKRATDRPKALAKP